MEVKKKKNFFGEEQKQHLKKQLFQRITLTVVTRKYYKQACEFHDNCDFHDFSVASLSFKCIIHLPSSNQHKFCFIIFQNLSHYVVARAS